MADTKLYVGTKIIKAKPMTRGEYNELRGFTTEGTTTNGDDTGYLVEYTDANNSNVQGFKGYVTWTPSKPFEMAYREIDSNSIAAIVEFNEAAA